MLQWNQQGSIWVPALLSVPLEYLSRSGIVDHMVILCLIFWGTTKLFPTAPVPFYIPTSGSWGFQFLCILTNTYFLFVLWLLFVCFFLTTTILVGMKWCLIVVWNFISLMTSDVQHLFMGVEHLSCLSCIKGILIS